MPHSAAYWLRIALLAVAVCGCSTPKTSGQPPRRPTYHRSMAFRIAGVLAVVGGAAWLAKIALIWENGGTNTTDGLVGVLFVVGAVGILLGAGIRAWHAPARGLLRHRTVALLAVVIAFAAAVNLPILLGWALLGRTWLAEEVGVMLTAVAAIALGTRGLSAGARAAPPDESRRSESR